MIRKVCNSISGLFGREEDVLWRRLLQASLRRALAEQCLGGLCDKLRRLEPRIVPPGVNDPEFWELKRRMQHAFQCTLMLAAAQRAGTSTVRVIDIGGTGTHMAYLQGLLRGRITVTPLSVNISPDAVAQIRGRGQQALFCRGEEIHTRLKNKKADFFVAFEILEHLHNPALFLRRLAKHFDCSIMVITVPYRRQSRMGLFNLRQGSSRKITACDEHIFELSPGDWELLMLHAGWKIRQSRILYQYPRSLPVVSRLLARLWHTAEFEGFFGAILEKDTTCSDCYIDWEE